MENVINFTGLNEINANAVSESEIERYTNEAIDCLNYHGTEDAFTVEGVKRNIEKWLENKTFLINTLRKHPNWDERKKAVVMEGTETRSATPDERWNEVYCLLRWASTSLGYEYCGINSNYISVIKTLSKCDEITSSLSASLKLHGIEAPVGLKPSRALQRALKKVPVWNRSADNYDIFDITTIETGSREDKTYDSYEKRFAIISDMMNKKETKRTFVLSVNFNDYLTMSVGNSWRSCHNLVDGEYRAGCLSYADDRYSLIFYTLPKEPDKEDFLWKNNKINRQVFIFNGDTLVQSRLYPQKEEYMSDIAATYRTSVESIFETCLGVKFKLTEESSDTIARTAEGYHYQDTHYYKDRCHVSCTGDVPTKIYYGANGFCLKCGRELDNEFSMDCGNCNESSRCYECEEYVREDDLIRAYRRGNEVYVCQDCLDNDYRYCENDEEYHYYDDCTYVERDDVYVTNDYYNNHYYCCHGCEEDIEEDFVIYVRGYSYCIDCARERLKDYIDELDFDDIIEIANVVG